MAGLFLVAAPSLAAGEFGFFKKSGDHVRSKMADTTRPTTQIAEPAKVYVGMHVLRLSNLDVPKSQFDLDFWMWFRWQNDSLKPYQTFELTNGKVNSCQIERVEKVGGMNYACVRVQATLTCVWNIKRFPLCHQQLMVQVEDDDCDSSQLVFLPDAANSGVDDDFYMPGWVCQGLAAQAATHTYKTNYGQPENLANKETRFSRFVATLSLKRADMLHALKIFTGMYMAALVAFTIFFVKADHRLGLTVGAIFAVVASHTVVSSYLPEAGVLTLTDKLHFVTVCVILVSLFETAYALHLLHQDKKAQCHRLDRITFWITAPLFVIANVWLMLA